VEQRIERSKILSILFRGMFDQADIVAVLSSTFREKLQRLGFRKEILLETTTVDDSLLNGFSLTSKIREIKSSEKLQILFLSRLQVTKGVIETIDAFSKLHREDRDLELVIAGDGSDGNLVRKRVEALGDNRIKLVGYVRGEEKRKILENSHLLCFPTYYGEGLPNSIIEAMAFGIPIITRPVGGIPDNVREGENVYYVPSLNGNSLEKLLNDVISDKEGLAKMATNNYNVSRERFLSSIVAKRLDNIYKKVVNG
jgi:glycosyltransferase involved in cell wall biosynthesis